MMLQYLFKMIQRIQFNNVIIASIDSKEAPCVIIPALIVIGNDRDYYLFRNKKQEHLVSFLSKSFVKLLDIFNFDASNKDR